MIALSGRKKTLLIYVGLVLGFIGAFALLVNLTCSTVPSTTSTTSTTSTSGPKEKSIQQIVLERKQEKLAQLGTKLDVNKCTCPDVNVAASDSNVNANDNANDSNSNNDQEVTEENDENPATCPPVAVSDSSSSSSTSSLHAVPVKHPTTRLDEKDPDVILFHADKHPTKRRTGAKIIMGIPTVRRPAAIYVTETLDSLVNRATPDELNQMVFVLFLADKDPALLEELFTTVYSRYPQHFASGLIETVIAKEGAYRPWPHPLRRTFGDAEERVKWRSKENYDYALLMEYCKGRAEFYMQLEDDILAAKNYFKGILVTVERAKDFQPPWSMLEFTRLGSFAKLFRDSELFEIAALLRYFYLEQPTDWMMFNFVAIKMQNNRIFSTNALFQHIGKQSSLKGKTQDLVDYTFNEDGNPGGVDGRPGDEVYSDRSKFPENPPAEIVTNIVHRNHYTPQAFYANKRPLLAWIKPGHWIEIWFEKPVVIKRFLLRSGHPTRPTDVLRGARISALYVGKTTFSSITTGELDIDTRNFGENPVTVLKISVEAEHHYQTCFEQISIEV